MRGVVVSTLPKDSPMRFPPSRIRGTVAVGAAVIVLCAAGLHRADTKPKNKKGGGVKALDARVEKLEATLFREIVDLSGQYEDAGQFDRAKSLLEVLSKLNPDLPGLKEKLDKLEEKSFDAHEIEFTLDTSRGWTSVGAAVKKGEPVRVEVDGDYKFSVTASVTADGFPSGDPTTDYVEGIPCGALMGMVSVNGKPGKPVPLKAQNTWTPGEDGMLFLKVNAPAGHRCTGKLTVKLSGLAESPAR
jgi:hypothetical protein